MKYEKECATALSEFFSKNMPLTTRSPKDSATGMRYPYTVPSVQGFRDFFYWDTCFANWGLLSLNMFSQAKNNLLNMSDFIFRYGYVPNANVLTNRSQPPLFTRAVDDYVAASGDNSIIRELLPAMIKEHDFWMQRRTAPCGLAVYGSEATVEELLGFNIQIAERLGILPEDLAGGPDDKNLIAAAESGWDFSSRFFDGMTCVAAKICPVDLNSILFDEERTIGRFALQIGDTALSEAFFGYAEKRSERMKQFMYDEKYDIFVDYDYEKNSLRACAPHAASFAAAAYGVSASKKGLSRLLKKLEFPYGLAVCAENEFSSRFQWDYPFMWAPVTAIACRGLLAAGLKEDALRVMRKYCATVEEIFRKTGNLWEKYNAVTGKRGDSCEYETPPMLGWTAGVYLRFRETINTIKSEEESL